LQTPFSWQLPKYDLLEVSNLSCNVQIHGGYDVCPNAWSKKNAKNGNNHGDGYSTALSAIIKHCILTLIFIVIGSEFSENLL
jgi:hypothetical protein